MRIPARCRGQYRHDAVVGAAELIMRLQDEWLRFEREGHDMVYTVGMLSTDPAQHAFSKISGDVRLSIDVRSHDVRHSTRCASA
jgi:N-carbamoyl-L-amino-acid hydrolase